MSRISSKKLKEYFLEEYIDGRFLTVGLIVLSAGLITLPIVEVNTGDRFYDEKIKLGKYPEENRIEYIVPANLPREISESITRLSKESFLLTRCEGIARVDIILDNRNMPHILEINTIPGISSNSNLTHAFANFGFTYAELVLVTLRTAFLK